MIGLNYSKRTTLFRNENLSKYDKYLLKEKWHCIDNLLLKEGEYFDDRAIASTYDGYPISKWEDEIAIYILEGIVYNIPEIIIKDKLARIAETLSIELVGNLVKEADGDFVFFVYIKSTKQVLFFNDELGGLPFYYNYTNNSFVAGRNCTYIAALSKDCKLSKLNMAELLCFNYNMADRTIFDHIMSLNPAMYIKVDETEEGSIKMSTGSTVKRSYSLDEPFKSREEAVVSLKELFIEGCKNRCDFARTHGYSIVNTMSGGFDSRTVLGGIEACIPSEEYQNMTYEYDRDESVVAAAVLKAIGSKSEYIKLSYENTPNLYNRELSFETEGKISTYTNSICYNDLMYSHENCFNGKKLLYFGGFGGEYIRHPLFVSIWNSSNIGSKTSPTLREVSQLCDIKYKDARELMKLSFKDCHSSEAFCKLFYDEYYRRYVRGAGEERIRMFYFSVQPMMSKQFILAIRNRVPLEWVGFEFYTSFLNAINPELTSIGLHGRGPDFPSIRVLRKWDFKNKSCLSNIYRWAVVRYHLRIQKGSMDYESMIRQIDVNSISEIFNKDSLEKQFSQYTIHAQSKIASLLFYVDELYKQLNNYICNKLK